MTDRIEFSCKACGTRVTFDKSNPPDDADHLFCSGCGHDFGTFGDVKAATLELAKLEVERITKDILGAKPKWK